MRKLRTIVYARHSTVKQNHRSTADQSLVCADLVWPLDAELVATFEDPEISGYRRNRPGLMRLLREVEARRVDLAVCEALNRITRDGETSPGWARSCPTTGSGCSRTPSAR